MAGGSSLALAPPVLGCGAGRAAGLPGLQPRVWPARSRPIYFACASTQAAEMGGFYRQGYWAESFPPLDRPWTLPALAAGHAHGHDDGVSGRRQARRKPRHAALRRWSAAWHSTGGSRKAMVAMLVAPFGMGLMAAGWANTPTAATGADHAIPGALDLPAGGTGAGRGLRRGSRGDAARGVLGFALLGDGGLRLGADRPGTSSRPIGSSATSGPASSPAGSGGRRRSDAELVCVKSDLGLSLNRGYGRSGCPRSTCSTSGSTRTATGGTSRYGSTPRVRRGPAAPAGRLLLCSLRRRDARALPGRDWGPASS